MSKTNNRQLAAKLTLIYFVSALIFTIIYFPVALISHIPKTAFVSSYAALVIIITYWSVGWYLRKNSNKWNIAVIKENEGLRNFKGIPLAALMFGFYWRNWLVGFFAYAVAAMLKGMYGTYLNSSIGFSLDLIALMFSSFVAFYWLLNAQYGSFKIISSSDAALVGNIIVEGNESIRDAKTSIKESVVGVLGTTAVASYFVLGLVQILATYDFFRHYWDWNALGSFFAAMFIGYTPIIGSFAGVIGATKVWGWDLWAALLLFFYPFAIMIVVAILGGGVSILGSVFNKR